MDDQSVKLAKQPAYPIANLHQQDLLLIIQIPCFNEADTLPEVMADLPRSLPGVGRVEILVIDDGSTDNTVEVARRCGVQHVVSHGFNRGLAAAYQTGIDTALRLGAAIIVNTDGDNQYPGSRIGDLIAPILSNQADIVVGDRQPHTLQHFSPTKRLLQWVGSWVVRLASGTQVPDATSGFRALSREAALRQIVLTRFSYTLETIIQAGKKGLRVAHLPIMVNPTPRQSRLHKGNWNFVQRQAAIILRIYMLYEPLRTFLLLATPMLLAGVFLLARFLYFYFTLQTASGRHIQSVLIGGTLIIVGFLIVVVGILADISATQRALLEELLYRQRKAELERDYSRE
ncbi:MAG: glycosyltransferase family 2 protein [Caldilineaceae bacterium]|nr:glycosyltransferase family 2 protein [Caldilineaceae bacterium]